MSVTTGFTIPDKYVSIDYDIIVIIWHNVQGLYNEFRFIGNALDTSASRSMSQGGYYSSSYYTNTQILFNNKK